MSQTNLPTGKNEPVAKERQHRRAPKGEKRREELLDAALQVFSLEGYSGASMGQVASIVGISLAGLLHHFPNKISLLMGVLELRDKVNQKIADEVRSEEKSLSGLLGSLRAINRSNATAPGVVRAFTILNTESMVEGHPAWSWFQERYERIHARLIGQFSELVEMGEVRADVDLPEICTRPDHHDSIVAPRIAGAGGPDAGGYADRPDVGQHDDSRARIGSRSARPDGQAVGVR